MTDNGKHFFAMRSNSDHPELENDGHHPTYNGYGPYVQWMTTRDMTRHYGTDAPETVKLGQSSIGFERYTPEQAAQELNRLRDWLVGTETEFRFGSGPEGVSIRITREETTHAGYTYAYAMGKVGRSSNDWVTDRGMVLWLDGARHLLAAHGVNVR